MPVPEALAAELSTLVRKAQADERLPSVAAGVFRAGEVAWAEAVGLADAERGEEATLDHQYRVGSITKSFTAAAIMQLRDAGELDLEDRLEAHIPEAVHGSPTLRSMLSHLSGLQREAPGDLWEEMSFPDIAGLLDTLASAEQVHPVGRHWHYSNLAYALLGEVVTRRGGMPYEHYVEERLFGPVGLKRTSWEASPPFAQGYLVEPYEDVARPEPLPDLKVFRSAGQLWSTVGDLASWGSFLADPNPDVLRPQSADEMRAFQGMSDLQRWSAGYGLGLQLFRDGDRVFYGHSGGMPGYITFLACSAPERTGAVVLTAASGGRIAGQLCLKLAGRAAEALAMPPEPWRPAAPAPDELTAVLGSWWFEDTEFLLRYVGGKLQVSFPAIPQVAPGVFEREGEDVYRSISGYERGELLRIVRDDSGEPVKLYLATYPVTRHPQVFGL